MGFNPVDLAFGNMNALRSGNERLRAENAKLRELVNGWDFCSKTKGSTFDNCVGCPLFIQTPHNYRCIKNEHMCELGIKVNYK